MSDTFLTDLDESLVVSSSDDTGNGALDPKERAQILQHNADVHKQNLKHADDRHQQTLRHTDEMHKQNIRHREEAHKQNLQVAKQQGLGIGIGGALYQPSPVVAPASPSPVAGADRSGDNGPGTTGVSGSIGATGSN